MPSQMKIIHRPRCLGCGGVLELQPIWLPKPGGECEKEIVYRCPTCAAFVVHPHPSVREIVEWRNSHLIQPN